MKIILSFLISFFFVSSSFGQTSAIGNPKSGAPKEPYYKRELPNSLVNFELSTAGISGSFGVKMVFGSHNTGLLLGLGRSIRLGYQKGLKYGSFVQSNVNLSFSGVGLYVGPGYTFSFGKRKRCYYSVEAELGLLKSGSILFNYEIYSGFGFRLGTPAKTTYEGVKNVTTVPIKP